MNLKIDSAKDLTELMTFIKWRKDNPEQEALAVIWGLILGIGYGTVLTLLPVWLIKILIKAIFY